MKFMNNMRQAAGAVMFVAGIVAGANAQTKASSTAPLQSREPSTTTHPYVVARRQDIIAVERGLRPDNKRHDLVGERGGLQTVMYVQHEKGKESEAEVHDASDDYHIIMEGTALYTLGGRLDAPRELLPERPGEWRSKNIVGGREVIVKKGDIIFVPRGTAHKRDTTGRDNSMMLIKIYAELLPVKPAAAKR